MKFVLILSLFLGLSVAKAASFPTGTFECTTNVNPADPKAAPRKHVFKIVQTKFSVSGSRYLSLPLMEVTSDYQEFLRVFPYGLQAYHFVLSGIATVLESANGDVELSLPGSVAYNQDDTNQTMSLKFDKGGTPLKPTIPSDRQTQFGYTCK